MSRSQENVSPAVAIPRMNDQIAGQSPGSVSLMSMLPSMGTAVADRYLFSHSPGQEPCHGAGVSCRVEPG